MKTDTIKRLRDERDLARGLYEELDARTKRIVTELTRRLQVADEKAEQLSRENTALSHLTREFALEKDASARALVKMTLLLDQAVKKVLVVAH